MSSLKAGAVGFLAQILFLPLLVITIVVLVVTIVGIPLLLLLPFAILAIAVVALVGFTGVAHRVGGIAARGSDGLNRVPYAVTVIGVLLLMLPVMLARLVSLGGTAHVPDGDGAGDCGIGDRVPGLDGRVRRSSADALPAGEVTAEPGGTQPGCLIATYSAIFIGVLSSPSLAAMSSADVASRLATSLSIAWMRPSLPM